MALETCDLRSSVVEIEEGPLALCLLSVAAGLSLKERSWTRLEKDILTVGEEGCGGERRGRGDFVKGGWKGVLAKKRALVERKTSRQFCCSLIIALSDKNLGELESRIAQLWK